MLPLIFALLEPKWEPQRYSKAISEWDRVAGNKVWPSYVLNNHDSPRSVTRWKDGEADARAKVGATMLLTLRGTPFLYYGEEIGMRDIRLKRSEIMDPPGKRYWPFYKGRDGCRSPMQWDASPQAGFGKSRPWLPVHPNYTMRNVAAQLKQVDSLLNVYKRLIALRRGNLALRRGDFILIKQAEPDCLVYQRIHGKQRMVVALNFSQDARTLKLDMPTDGKWVEVFSTRPLNNKAVSMDLIKLAGSQAVIFKPAAGK